jgi:fumarylacetoacetate (FAA) hydrolase
VIGTGRDLPLTIRELRRRFTIMNDWSARDLQRAEMAVGLGPSKSKDFATSLGPRLVPFDELRDCYRDGRLNLEMTATVNGKEYSRGNAGSMYWTWPQLLAHASRDTNCAGDVGPAPSARAIPELTKRSAVGLGGGCCRTDGGRIGTLRNTSGENADKRTSVFAARQYQGRAAESSPWRR